MAFGKLGARFGLGGMGASGGIKRGIGAVISGVINLAGDIRQSNLIGAAISGVASLAADISLSAGVQIGAVISGAVSLVAGLNQTNQVGASLSGTVSVSGDIVSANNTGLAMNMSSFTNTYILAL